MPRTGRPKLDDPIRHSVTVKFAETDYEIMVDYAKRHDLTISQMLRLGIQMQLDQEKSQEK